MDYNYYTTSFGGNLIPPELFNRFMLKAKAYFDAVTLCRSVPAEYREKASLALCEIAEVFMRYSSRGGIKSENTDGYSVSYDESALNLELSEIMNLYLGESDILFKGEI